MSWLQAARAQRLTRALNTAANNTTDALHPLLVIARGLLRLGRSARVRWDRTPSDRRGPALFLGAACALVVALTPYGPWLALGTLVAAAAWTGRERAAEDEPTGPSEEQCDRLQALYDAVAPCFCPADDPHPNPLYTPDGSWEQAFAAHDFTQDDRLEHLLLRYPAYFPDADPAARTAVEQVLTTKAGRDRDYLFRWEEEHNRLHMTVRPPLPAEVPSQHFATAPTETVLGFTDPESVQRRLPVTNDARVHELPPVIWRTGLHSSTPHLLTLGPPGSGTTNLLRSLLIQALPHNDIVVVDGAGEGAYAFLQDRPGVLAVETTFTGARSVLQWVAHETTRRLYAPRSGAAEGAGQSRPLWLVIDQLSLLAHLAAAQGEPDPQDLLETPLRHGHKAHVTVAIADQLPTATHSLSSAVHAHTHTKVTLGQTGTSPAAAPPGHGHAQLGHTSPLRLVVPHTPESPAPALPPHRNVTTTQQPIS